MEKCCSSLSLENVRRNERNMQKMTEYDKQVDMIELEGVGYDRFWGVGYARAWGCRI